MRQPYSIVPTPVFSGGRCAIVDMEAARWCSTNRTPSAVIGGTWALLPGTGMRRCQPSPGTTPHSGISDQTAHVLSLHPIHCATSPVPSLSIFKHTLCPTAVPLPSGSLAPRRTVASGRITVATWNNAGTAMRLGDLDYVCSDVRRARTNGTA